MSAASVVCAQAVSLQGVDVRLMIPWKSNYRTVDFAGRWFYEDLMQALKLLKKTGIIIVEGLGNKPLAGEEFGGLIGFKRESRCFVGLRLGHTLNVHFYGVFQGTQAASAR